MQARAFHQNFEELMQMLADELKVDQMEIFNTVKKLPKPEVLERKDRQIKELLKERTDLQARVDWAQGELEIAKTKEKDALQLVRNLSALVDQPAESVVKAALIQKQLNQDSALSGPKILRILVDFSSKMEVVLDEMRQLVNRVDPDKMMDFSTFPDLPTEGETPAKTSRSLPLPERPAEPMDPIRQSDETFTTQLQKTLQESEMQRQEQLLTPGKGQQLAPPEVTVSPQLPASRLKAADFLRNPGRTSTSSFAERIGGLLNPARSHPEDFEHMKPP
jgi:hypothetical protein